MLRRTARRDRLVGLFIAGVVLLNPPILNLFGGTLFGLPTAYVYVFAVWLLLIVALALVVEGTGIPPNDRTNSGTRR